MNSSSNPALDITKLLAVMVQHSASDLYITVGSAPMYRVDGVVRQAGSHIFSELDTENLARSVMNDNQQKMFYATNELNFGIHYSTLGRFRVNVYRQRGAIGMVIRSIKSKILTIEELNLPEILKSIAMTKRGLVLVVGATGSGKSTTLAALIDHRNANSPGHIVSIEDPIEFVHEHKRSIISQREVGLDTENYEVAIKNALRQAPDVVFIGEIRDIETMEAALTFSETGHLCLATLHSNNANQAMERIMNFFPVSRHPQIYMQLSLNLRAVISQRLLKSVDGSRIAAIEILLDSPRVKDLILKARISDLKEAMEQSKNIGMQTFDQALFDLYIAGKISLDEALVNADSVNNLRLAIKLKQSASAQALDRNIKGQKVVLDTDKSVEN
ncbi:MAG TPA: PilT/PilU family type 4a pilus ATPase [Oligoflexia bacterium]|nr:PilT/PilU family type 4a pilus ATPase [Oligoflexia bacterium]HMP27371.1 PilT/PilU family type 4a pilus ATPase [Oligoflexia bacterium]